MTAFCFFPFTHITEDQKRILGAFFRKVGVLDIDSGRTSRRDALKGEDSDPAGLVACPLSHDRAKALDRTLAEYLSWARIHRGNEKNLRHLLRETPYFKTDTDLTAIRSQIVGGSTSPGRDDRQGGPAPDSGLFLKLAQTLDQENEAIDKRLKALDKDKEALLAELKGEVEDGPGESGSSPLDQGEIMPDRRMAAWASLASEAGMFTGGIPLLVTTSPAILSWLEENSEEVINGLDIDSIKVHENGCGNKDRWLQDVETLLHQMMDGGPSALKQGDTLGKGSSCCHLSGRIQVRLFPDGELNRRYKIPGWQVVVCLVGLNA